MNKLLKAFFALDLWIALSLITTLICNILFVDNELLMISLTIALSVVNMGFCLILINSINFYKNKTVKSLNK